MKNGQKKHGQFKRKGAGDNGYSVFFSAFLCALCISALKIENGELKIKNENDTN
jgi:hypothetical protein